MNLLICASETGSASGTRDKRRFNFAVNVNLRAGTNRISLLSVLVGLPVGLSTLSAPVKL